jgi:hypothetical protein
LLSRRLRQFISGSLRSVWTVELLLLLRREPERVWSPDELVRELRGSGMLVAENLKLLCAGGVAQEVEPKRFSYCPASRLLRELCDELEQEYRQRPVTVVNAIIDSATSNVQGLADAFRFRETDK